MYRCVCFVRLYDVFLLFVFFHFYVAWSISPSFLFYFCLSPQCILPLFVFSFPLHSFRSFLLLSLVFDLYVSRTSVTLCCCFLFSCLCQCIIVFLFYEPVYIVTDKPITRRLQSQTFPQ